jgi:crossover junction endodeoxyribonuclease RusA
VARRPAERQRSLGYPALEVCIHGQPVSAQTGNRRALQAWKDRVRTACEAAWGAGRPPIEGSVTIRVTHYCETIIGDVDNLMKPIQDALQGIAYTNDRQVSDAIGNRRNIEKRFRIRYISMSLATAFSDGRPFVHIRVWRSPKREELG